MRIPVGVPCLSVGAGVLRKVAALISLVAQLHKTSSCAKRNVAYKGKLLCLLFCPKVYQLEKPSAFKVQAQCEPLRRHDRQGAESSKRSPARGGGT